MLHGYRVSLYIQKQMIFIKTLQKMLKLDHTSNYELDRTISKGKNRKVTGLIKDELDGKIMTKIVELRAKTYGYLIDDVSEDKKSKNHKKVCHKKKT